MHLTDFKQVTKPNLRSVHYVKFSVRTLFEPIYGRFLFCFSAGSNMEQYGKTDLSYLKTGLGFWPQTYLWSRQEDVTLENISINYCNVALLFTEVDELNQMPVSLI